MYVLCVGMMRAGSTWQYQVAAELLEQRGWGVRLGFLEGARFLEHERDQPADARWPILKAHVPHPRFAALLAEGRARGLYCYRDLRDVTYSFLQWSGEGFQEVVRERGVLDRVLGYYRFWTAQPAVLVQRYESMLAEPVPAVHQIATHLGLSITDAEASAVAAKYSLEANRQRASAFTERVREAGIDLDAPDRPLVVEAATLLHWNHIRDGGSGLWRRLGSPDELRTLAAICGQWLIERGYERDLSWVDRPDEGAGRPVDAAGGPPG